MALTPSLLSIDSGNSESCLLCDISISKNDSVYSLSQHGWDNLKKTAKDWKEIDIDPENKYFSFRQVHERIQNLDEAFGKVHKTCRLVFGTKIENFRKRYGEIKRNTCTEEDEVESLDSSELRKSQRKTAKAKSICFICNEVRKTDSGPYNQGGLGRCEQKSSRDKIQIRTELFLSKSNHRFYEAAKRLQVLQGGQSFDLFAIDIFYHKSCYIKYAINRLLSIEEEEQCLRNEEEADVKSEFFRAIRLKVIRKKEAFLLHQLLSDVKNMCDVRGIEHVFKHTVSLKRALIKEFEDEIDFFPKGRHVIVHSSLMNPCEFSVAALEGHGLRDDDYVRSFSNFIKMKMKQHTFESLPHSPDEMIQSFNKGPIKELYNTIYATMYPDFNLDNDGYAITQSSNIANRISSVAFDWQCLITRQKTGKQAMLGLTIHRLTGSKEAVMHLHSSGHSISYNDILQYNNVWSSTQIMPHKRFMRGLALHSTIDNNDGRQETLTGVGTTHDTNATLFQPLLTGECRNPVLESTVEELVVSDETCTQDIPEYSLGQRSDPMEFPLFQDDESINLLEESFRKDIAWSVANGLTETQDTPELPPLGSWTAFNRKVSDRKQQKSLIEYLPVINQPPNFAVCKNYLDYLQSIVKDLELEYIFAHADEEVYAKLAQIIWKHGSLYKNIIIIMGGFHQLRVRQRLISKRHSCAQYPDWLVDAGTIAPGSVDKAFGGKHYYRCMRVLKESFDALVQYRTEQLYENYTTIPEELLTNLQNLREHPSPETLITVSTSSAFEELFQLITSTNSPQQSMTVAYLRDISSLLAMVSAVRESDFERHLQAERAMLKQVFAFDHQNYARYMTYQHVFLTDLKLTNNKAYQDLSVRGFGANYSGDNFAAVHGDLVTEYFNRETKGTAGPFRSGYSTNIDTTNKWVKNVHIHAKLRVAMRDKLNLRSSSTHKELTDSGKAKHNANVTSLKKKLYSYNTDPFSNGPAKTICTGQEIDKEIVNSVLSAPDIGNEKYKEFVAQRLVSKEKSIFEPIKRLNIKTGIEKAKKTPKAISILKEDRQAFGLLVAKATSLEEAFSFPITTLPLSISTPDGTLRQSEKASFRNYLINEAEATLSTLPVNARWIIDGMALFRSVKPKETYRCWLISVLLAATPHKDAQAKQIEIVNDTYLTLSTKSSTRIKRGDISRRVHLESVDQKMLQGKDWAQFFNNNDNKEDLIRLASSFFKSDEGRKLLKIPLVISCKEDTWKIRKDGVEKMPNCNHEEADTRLVLHAAREESPAVIVAKDTDVLVLLIYGMTQMSTEKSWYMKIDHEKYVNVRKIFEKFGPDVCTALPQIHALTGCDTTAYKFNVGKVKVLKKVIKDASSLALIRNLGAEEVLTDDSIADARRFFQTVMYNGGKNESYVETRVKHYLKMKVKSSAPLLPDPDSACQEIKRVHLQCYIWLNCLRYSIATVDISNFGWTIDYTKSTITPKWFVGKQLPNSLIRSKKSRSRNNRAVGFEADEEIEKDEGEPPRKRKTTKKRSSEVSRQIDSEMEYEECSDEVRIEKDSSDSEWESDFSSSEEEKTDSSDSDFLP